MSLRLLVTALYRFLSSARNQNLAADILAVLRPYGTGLDPKKD